MKTGQQINTPQCDDKKNPRMGKRPKNVTYIEGYKENVSDPFNLSLDFNPNYLNEYVRL